jgi:hypothetical protein
LSVGRWDDALEQIAPEQYKDLRCKPRITPLGGGGDRGYSGLYAVGGYNSVYLGTNKAFISKLACSEAQPIE